MQPEGTQSSTQSWVESVHVEEWTWHDGHAHYRVTIKLSDRPTTHVVFRRYSAFAAVQSELTRLAAEPRQGKAGSSAVPKLPSSTYHAIQSAFSSWWWAPSTDLLDRRCRDLDWYLQQVHAWVGADNSRFWNAPAIAAFFSDEPQARLLAEQDTDAIEIAHVEPPAMPLQDWDGDFHKAEQLMELLRKQHVASANNPQGILTSHYRRVAGEFVQLVQALHGQLQLHSTDWPDAADKWRSLEPLMDYRDRVASSMPCDDNKEEERPEPGGLPVPHSPETERLCFQDRQLELLSESIGRLKALGTEMDREARQQIDLADDISKLTGDSQARTESAARQASQL